MVRKYFIELAAVIALLAQGIIYPSTMVITDIDYTTDTVVVENANGFIYTFEGVEDLMPGDFMSVIMYNNGTPWTIEDDWVISARYSGYIDQNLHDEYVNSEEFRNWYYEEWGE